MGSSGLAEPSEGAPRTRAGAAAVLERVERLAQDGVEPPDLTAACAELREAVLQLAEDGELSLAEARRISRNLDQVLGRALERAQEPARALAALDEAVGQGLDDLPRIALTGAESADSAALLLVVEQGRLEPRATAGLEAAEAQRVSAQGTVSAEAAQRREAIHVRTAMRHPLALAEGIPGTRALAAVPVLDGEQVLGVLRIGSRTAYAFGVHELRLLRALASRAASLLTANAAVATQEARARHAKRTLESLIEAAPLPVLSVDLNGIVRIWNRAAEEVFGWRRDEVIGRPNPSVPPDLRDESRQILRDIQGGAVIRDRPVRRLRKDGTSIELSFAVAPVQEPDGRVSGSIGIFLDLSQRRQSEAAAERTARFREQFLGIVGHDLRNPLTAILSSAQMLLRYSSLDDRQRRVLGRIESSAGRMTRMIEELLDFTRGRLGGGFPIVPRRVDLGEIAEQCIEELSLAHAQRRIDLDLSGDLWGDWDPGRLAQVLSNLIGNALQHSPDGSPVRVTVRAEGEEAVFETHNGGSPIPNDLLPHIFEPGRRGEGVRSAGLGLGLYIAQQIVQAHGGSLEARSDTAGGTVFRMRLPRKGRQKPDAAVTS